MPILATDHFHSHRSIASFEAGIRLHSHFGFPKHNFFSHFRSHPICSDLCWASSKVLAHSAALSFVVAGICIYKIIPGNKGADGLMERTMLETFSPIQKLRCFFLHPKTECYSEKAKLLVENP